MGLWADWRSTRERRQRASEYLRAFAHEPDAADVAWLAGLLSSGDVNIARRELHIARRALALVVAERDALDDQTASDVTHVLTPILQSEARRDPAAARQWTDRWRAYSASLATRGGAESPHMRIARVLLEGTGVASPTPDQLTRGVQVVQTMRAAANEALRSAFGAASLPDDIRPSALKSNAR